jgi:hypothetical protein
MMEDILLLPESEIFSGKNTRSKMIRVFLTREHETENPFIESLISEGGEIFFNYLCGLGHTFKPNMMLLSSRRNYYYDYTDLIGVSTVINLKRLNRVAHLESFLNAISGVVAQGTCFVACFADSTTKKINGISTLNSSRQSCYKAGLLTETEIDKTRMISMLESSGFKVYDMTEIKGLTYFLATKK